MLRTREITRILAYRPPVDMRKSFDGLLSVVKGALQEDPLSGTLFVFTNRKRTHLKSIYWDRTGFCLFAKRLERGQFTVPSAEERVDLSEQAFSLFLDGIALGVTRRML